MVTIIEMSLELESVLWPRDSRCWSWISRRRTRSYMSWYLVRLAVGLRVPLSPRQTVGTGKLCSPITLSKNVSLNQFMISYVKHSQKNKIREMYGNKCHTEVQHASRRLLPVASVELSYSAKAAKDLHDSDTVCYLFIFLCWKSTEVNKIYFPEQVMNLFDSGILGCQVICRHRRNIVVPTLGPGNSMGFWQTTSAPAEGCNEAMVGCSWWGGTV